MQYDFPQIDEEILKKRLKNDLNFQFFAEIWLKILIKSKHEEKICPQTEVFYEVKFWSLGER